MALLVTQQQLRTAYAVAATTTRPSPTSQPRSTPPGTAGTKPTGSARQGCRAAGGSAAKVGAPRRPPLSIRHASRLASPRSGPTARRLSSMWTPTPAKACRSTRRRRGCSSSSPARRRRTNPRWRRCRERETSAASTGGLGMNGCCVVGWAAWMRKRARVNALTPRCRCRRLDGSGREQGRGHDGTRRGGAQVLDQVAVGS